MKNWQPLVLGPELRCHGKLSATPTAQRVGAGGALGHGQDARRVMLDDEVFVVEAF